MLDSPEGICAVRHSSKIQLLPYSLVSPFWAPWLGAAASLPTGWSRAREVVRKVLVTGAGGNLGRVVTPSLVDAPATSPAGRRPHHRIHRVATT
jgi:hypothetical protein